MFALLMSCSGPSVIRSGYVENQNGHQHDCNLAIIKHRAYTGSQKPIGHLIVKDNGFSTNCSEAEVMEIIRNEGCSIGAKVAHLRNIIEPSIWGSTCFQTEVDFYGDSPKYFAESKTQSVQVDTISNKGFWITGLFGIGSVLGGKQKDHEIYFYSLETGAEVASSTGNLNFGLEFAYYFNEWFGTLIGYDFRFVSTSPFGGGAEHQVDLFRKQIFRINPRIAFYRNDSYMGKSNLYLSAGGSFVLMSLENDFKDILRSEAYITPYESTAKGFGGFIGPGFCYILPSKILFDMLVEYEYDSEKFESGAESLDANNLNLRMGMGYKF